MSSRRLITGAVCTTVAALVGSTLLVGGAARAEPSSPAATSPPDHVLVDLEPGAYYEAPVRWLHGAGLTNGVRPGRFGPGRGITRAEVVTMLWRTAGAPTSAPSSFGDVPRGAYYAAAVDWAAAAGLTNGVAPGRFAPAAAVDRAQMVTMLWRRADEPVVSPSTFVDVARDAYYTPAVDWAAAMGIAEGVGGSRFAPQSPLTRAQAAAFLWRAAGRPPAVAPTVPAYTSSVSTVERTQLPHSWRPGCPVHHSDLRLLTLRHIGFDGRSRTGRLVLHHDAVDVVDAAFAQMYTARFPIERVTLVDDVGGDDDTAMAANLTTAFNCRAVTGGTGWSEHSYGRAVDINPLQNPYVSRTGMVLPPGGAAHLDRDGFAVGRIAADSAPVGAFERLGWGWGGRWSSIRDYQHFSATGR